jgi:hypothetical protein
MSPFLRLCRLFPAPDPDGRTPMAAEKKAGRAMRSEWMIGARSAARPRGNVPACSYCKSSYTSRIAPGSYLGSEIATGSVRQGPNKGL